MFVRIFLYLACLFASAHADEPVSYDAHMAAAREAFVAEDWPALATALEAAQAYRPYSLYLTKNRVLAYEMSGDRAKALAVVRKIAERGLAMTLSGHEGFDALKNDPAFAEIAARMEANADPIGESEIVGVGVGGPLTEAVFIEADKSLITGAVRTGEIFQIPGPESEVDYPHFFTPGGVFDVELRQKVIWAAVNNQLAYWSGARDPEPPFAAIIAYDRTTGNELVKIILGGEDALIGDLEITGDGVIYASDSITPRLFRVEPGDAPQITELTDPRFVNLQGIALDEANGRMFIADYLTGLYVMDLEAGDVKLIRNDADAHLGGVDGLYYYKGDLIGVQNGTTPQRIVRISLSEDGAAATALNVLAQNLPEWNEPTHGVVVGAEFYYIATSNWPSYDEAKGWTSRDDNPPQPLRIMAVGLD